MDSRRRHTRYPTRHFRFFHRHSRPLCRHSRVAGVHISESAVYGSPLREDDGVKWIPLREDDGVTDKFLQSAPFCDFAQPAADAYFPCAEANWGSRSCLAAILQSGLRPLRNPPQLGDINKRGREMEDCPVQVKPPLVLHRRQRRLTRTPLLTPAARDQQRRGFLQFWRRARERHLQARVNWRSKLNSYLSARKT